LPIHKSAEKRLKTSHRANVRNKQLKSGIKTLIKKTEASPDEALLKQTASALDSAARKSVIHPNKAARTKSRLAKLVNKKKTAPSQ
jgi:small subunit ribosomal protein S20